MREIMMKTYTSGPLWAVFFLAGALMAADNGTAKKPDAPALRQAVPVKSAGVSRIDEHGKKWLEVLTPFGLARFEDNTAGASSLIEEGKKKELELTRAVEDGDSVRFERPGPFGTYRWTKKKTELDALEQAAWNRDSHAKR